MPILRVQPIFVSLKIIHADGSWKNIGGIANYSIWAGNTINGNGSKIKIWATTIRYKWIVEAVINRTIVVISH